MQNLISEDYLMHHGVKGMKWGVRHDPERKGGLRASRDAIKRAGGVRQSIKDGREGVRQERLSKMAPDARNKAIAKQNYKAAKKQYTKSFNKYYYSNPLNAFTAKGRQKNWASYQKALVDAGNLGIARGKYLQAKGKASNNQAKITKGKRLVETASNTKVWNQTLLRDIEKGYTYKEAYSRNESKRDALVKKQKSIDAKYKK